MKQIDVNLSFPIRRSALLLCAGLLCGGATVAHAANGERYVVYIADQDTNDTLELYRADLRTGAVTKLNGPLGPVGDLAVTTNDGPAFSVDPKGKFVVYLADQETNDLRELWRADFKTGVVTKLNASLVGTYGVLEFEIDPKRKFVVYTADQDTAQERELYKVDLKTLARTKLNQDVPSNRDVLDVQVASDGKSVFYCHDVAVSGQYELWRYDLNTDFRTQLSGPLVSGGSLHVTIVSIVEDGTPGPPYRIDPKGKFAVYRADQTTNDKRELYKVDFATGVVTTLNGPLASNRDLFEFQIDPKGKFVIYTANQDALEKRELYKVDLETLAVTKLNQPLFTDGFNSGDVLDIEIDAAGKFVAYRANEANLSLELFKVDLKTLGVTKLSTTLPLNGNIDRFELRTSAKKGFYLGDQITGGVTELFQVDLVKGDKSWLLEDTPMVLNGDVLGFHADSKGKCVVYLADQEVNGRDELFALDVKTKEATKINPELATGGKVFEFLITR